MNAVKCALSIFLLMLMAGCQQRLTGTRLDLLGLPLPVVPSSRSDDEAVAGIFAAFLKACDRDAEEIAPRRPFQVSHLYVYDATPNVVGMWGFTIFDNYKGWIDIYKTQADVSIINSLSAVEPGPGRYILKRAVLDSITIGQLTYRGGRQEFIDSVNGEIKASRTNYYLGSDFARGVSCLDSNWAEGFKSFVHRSIGFVPGFPRNDAWVQETPRQFVHAELVSRKEADIADFKAPIRPTGSVYNYNDRRILLEGVPHYLRQTFNNEPLRMVGVHSFPTRVLISYETNARAPSALFQIRNKSSGQLLQEIFVRLPLSLYQRGDNTIQFRAWRIAQDGIAFENGKIGFDVIQGEDSGDPQAQRYLRYRLNATWDTEDIQRADLPWHLDDGSYESLGLPGSKRGGTLTAAQVIGKWISSPAGTSWEFKDDHTILLSGRDPWNWNLENGELTAADRFLVPRQERATFRISQNGNQLEVTRKNVSGTYPPFLLNRVDSGQ